MAIPKLNKETISEAFKWIDENGIPDKNQSTRYYLVMDNGKKYPPKYVIAVANHLMNGVELSTEGFNAVEAANFFRKNGYVIEDNQEKYELTITADNIISTDNRFTMDNLSLGDRYVVIDTFFEKENGDIIKRNRRKNEYQISNQTLPRLAFQIFERQIDELTIDEKENFPICKYKPDKETITGIYSSPNELKKARNSKSNEFLIYSRDDGTKFVIYSWNIFSTIIFVQECLKRFGNSGDKFKLIYREKVDGKFQSENILDSDHKESAEMNEFQNPYSSLLIESKNIVFHGAPGTGKSYLAKEIAADIISNGYYKNYDNLSDEQKEQVEFVQFHPSYDYTDFVEGLRPAVNFDGTIGFDLQDGIFKKFVNKAKKNYENSLKTKEDIEKELSVQDLLDDFFSSVEFGVDIFKTINGNEFTILDIDDKHINIYIPKNATANLLSLNLEELRKMLETDHTFEKIKDVTNFFGKEFATQRYSYYFVLYKAIKSKERNNERNIVKHENLKKYIFIIDEINRGEISKIFGELFFAIDPNYRGKDGAVTTQYSNMHADQKEKFYIPENIYIIGTMNDIDRSVDSFDFAMRRRFRFIELKANENMEMLENIKDEELREEATNRMVSLNNAISSVEDLNDNYQIGASYFLKLNDISFDKLWTDYLKPLLKEYVNGMYDEEGILKKLENAYRCVSQSDGALDENSQD